jgi:hypothetical protein
MVNYNRTASREGIIMRLFPIAVVLGVALGVAAGSAPARALDLITPAEAALPAAVASPMSFRGLTRGPTVEMVSPPADAASPFGPLTLDITFDAHNGAAVDPNSVKVTYLKQPAIDLTVRLKPYITAKGIAAANVTVPPGTHTIRIDVTDSEGRTTNAVMTIQVLAAK